VNIESARSSRDALAGALDTFPVWNIAISWG
jgi:hypothetical protein